MLIDLPGRGTAGTAVQNLPLRLDALHLLRYVQTHTIVGTAKGNMPRNHVRAVNEGLVRPLVMDEVIGDRVYPLQSEDHVPSLRSLRAILEVGGLLDCTLRRPWELTPFGERFLVREPMFQAIALLGVWFHSINWLMLARYQGIGDRLPDGFEACALEELLRLGPGQPMPVPAFCSALALRTRLVWQGGYPEHHAQYLRSTVEQLVVRPMERFGLVRVETSVIKDWTGPTLAVTEAGFLVLAGLAQMLGQLASRRRGKPKRR